MLCRGASRYLQRTSWNVVHWMCLTKIIDLSISRVSENQESLYWIPGGSNSKESVCKWETRVQFLGREHPLEKRMATHSIILAKRIPWTEEPRVGENQESLY